MSEIPDDILTIAAKIANHWQSPGTEFNINLRVEILKALMAERERADGAAEKLDRIHQWLEAYPIDIFPEPDWKKAHALLQAGGMTLDAVSAGAMRRVTIGIRAIIAPPDKPLNT